MANVFGSMRFAIFLFFVIFSVAIPLLFGRIMVNFYSSKLWNRKVETVENKCVMVADRLKLSGFQFTSMNESLDTEVEQFAGLIEGRIMVIDQNFRIVKDTFGIEENRYLMTEEVLRVMSGEDYIPQKTEGQYMEMYYPIKDSNNEKVTGVICLIASCQDVIVMETYMEDLYDELSFLFIMVLIVLSYVVSYYLTRQFKPLKKDVQYIADGHTDEQLKPYGYSELRDLTSTFNDILVKTQALEASRQEFVSNVSHELKTPITSVKVLAESLLTMPNAEPELYREFLADIVEEIDRENSIITDLLSLVKMDKKVAKLNVEKVDINELIESIVKRLNPIAGKKNIDLGFEPFRPVTAEVDKVKLTLAMTNLIENGIKYNKDDGWVRVYLNADHKFLYFKVEDSGEGISEEHQEHIFERFYRVDKARSRETGGTGLGLAITREVILLHKGAIRVHSVPGEGTTFTVRIPLTYMS